MSLDAMKRYIPGLRNPNAALRLRTAKTLRVYVESEARDLSPNVFSKFINDLSSRIMDMLHGVDSLDRIGGIVAMDELIDLFFAENNDQKIMQFAHSLAKVLEKVANTDVVTIRSATKALGHLVSTGGTTLIEFVEEYHMRPALTWLEKETFHVRRHAAVMILKELAANAPTMFYRHAEQYYEVIWNALGDSNAQIRESAAESLRVSLSLIQGRETNRKIGWYSGCLTEVERGLIKGSVESMHGSLLTINELLRNTGDYMYPHFEKVCKQVLQYKDHKSPVIRKAVIISLSRFAKFNRTVFVEKYIHESVGHLLKVLSTPSSLLRDEAFLSMGRITKACSSDISKIDNFIVDLMTCVKEGLKEQKKREQDVQREALACLRMVAEAMGPSLYKVNFEHLIDLMFKSGLNNTMIETLASLVKRVPNQRSMIQLKLFSRLSSLLSKENATVESGISASPPRTRTRKSSLSLSSKKSQAFRSLFNPGKEGAMDPTYLAAERSLQILALDTLGSFDLQGNRHITLMQFVHNDVVHFLDSDVAGIRKAAATTCCKLVLPHGEEAPVRGEIAMSVSAVLERLLTVGIADPEADIRSKVLASLDSRFDPLLCQRDSLRCLFIALNDEVFEIRERAMTLLGRLTLRNPSYVMPSLRQTLVQLLQELEYSGDSRGQEEGAKLLGHFIRSASYLSRPYVLPILKALVKKVHDGNSSVSVAVLATLGELAVVGSGDLIPYLDQLLPVVLEAIQDHSSPQKLTVAIRTLGQLVSSTGYVVYPYYDCPSLLELLCSVLQRSGESNQKLRLEAGRTLGILGALDPYNLKLIQEAKYVEHPVLFTKLSKHGCPWKIKESIRKKTTHVVDGGGTASSEAMPPRVPVPVPVIPLEKMLPFVVDESKQYFPAVAINALVRILSDSRNASHYQGTILAVMYICRSGGKRSVVHLDQIIPSFMSLLGRINHNLREFLFEQLASLVRIAGKDIQLQMNYSVIASLVKQYWSSHLNALMCLIEELASSLEDDFKVYLPDLLPRMLDVIRQERENPLQLETQLVLRTIVSIGELLNGYLHLVIPVLVKLVQSGAELLARRQALLALRSLIREINVSEFASKIIHMLGRTVASVHEDLVTLAMDCLCCMIYTLREDYIMFIPVIHQVLVRRSLKGGAFEKYDLLVSRILKQQRLPPPTWSRHKLASRALESSDVNSEEMKALPINEQNLVKAWENSHRSTKDDWYEWMRAFQVELLRESPSPSLRACKELASVYRPLAQELFNASFVSIWPRLSEPSQDNLIRTLERAFQSPYIPSELLQTLLNLAEFMEHDDQPLPIDIRMLGALAEKCHSFAKALHYKELEFNTSPSADGIDSLISINNKLNQFEAAMGILKYAQGHLADVQVKASWHEKLRRWDDALKAHEEVLQDNPLDVEAAFGKMRSLYAVGQWVLLNEHVTELWARIHGGNNSKGSPITFNVLPAMKKELCSYAARVSLVLQRWDVIPKFITPDMDPVEAHLFRAVSNIRSLELEDAYNSILDCRKVLDASLRSLVSESYSRAYMPGIVYLENLVELEEVLEYTKMASRGNPSHHSVEAQTLKNHLKNIWTDRLLGVEQNVHVWQQLMVVRSLVLDPKEDVDVWLKYAKLCRDSGHMNLALSALWRVGAQPFIRSVEANPFQPNVSWTWSRSDALTPHPRVAFAYLKHMWAEGQEDVALQQLIYLIDALEHTMDESEDYIKLRVHAYIQLADWQMSLLEPKLQHEQLFEKVLSCLHIATELDTTSYKAWHDWALTNFLATEACAKEGSQNIDKYVAPAVNGFFRSILLGHASHDITKDVLRLLTLWFSYGHRSDVHQAMLTGFHEVSVDTWLDVIPQLIARIHTSNSRMNGLLHELLSRIGQRHPQALIYPITVASKSQAPSRKNAAEKILTDVRRHSPQLVTEAQLVSRELIRVAILWHEVWYEALEEASHHYFKVHDVVSMMECLAPLNEMMENIGKEEPPAMREIAFHQSFGMDLQNAKEWTDRYARSGCLTDLNQAWDIYYSVHSRIRKQLNQLTALELANVAPKLLSVQNLSLAVPGTYKAGSDVVRIHSFDPKLTVLSSKQRPRRVSIHGSNGVKYSFLLKGHEDLRQDERVMQLFGLINMLLSTDGTTSRRNLVIQRYSVLPLSHGSGLIGWVPNCDTLHQLIKEYREARKIPLNVESRLMNQMSSNYDKLPMLNKVEVFRCALSETSGQDLYKVLWLKSSSSEVWLDRRRNYTRSLAVMSMAGYILGLGDRHPSNLMLDRFTGKIVHIDFGDCFEVAMERDKYPEKVPFRLTRMLTQAMEVSGIEGNFRFTCESVMKVLRENKDSLLAVLEAFVYDPLISWRWLAPKGVVPPRVRTQHEIDYAAAAAPGGAVTSTTAGMNLNRVDTEDSHENPNKQSRNRQRHSSTDSSLYDFVPGGSRSSIQADRGREGMIMENVMENAEFDAEGMNGSLSGNTILMPELNEKALKVIDRVRKKLHGRDFDFDLDGSKQLSVEAQVDHLIHQATSHENLCQLYYGWCGFW